MYDCELGLFYFELLIRIKGYQIMNFFLFLVGLALASRLASVISVMSIVVSM